MNNTPSVLFNSKQEISLRTCYFVEILRNLSVSTTNNYTDFQKRSLFCYVIFLNNNITISASKFEQKKRKEIIPKNTDGMKTVIQKNLHSCETRRLFCI